MCIFSSSRAENENKNLSFRSAEWCLIFTNILFINRMPFIHKCSITNNNVDERSFIQVASDGKVREIISIHIVH